MGGFCGFYRAVVWDVTQKIKSTGEGYEKCGMEFRSQIVLTHRRPHLRGCAPVKQHGQEVANVFETCRGICMFLISVT